MLHLKNSNIKWLIAFYGVPLLLAIIFILPFLNISGNKLNSSFEQIYLTYITITTITLSVTFLVVTFVPSFVQIEQKRCKLPIFGSFPFQSVNILSICQYVLFLSFLGIFFSLMGYIFTTTEVFNELILKGLFFVNSFFVAASIFGLVLLTGELIKNVHPQLLQNP